MAEVSGTTLGALLEQMGGLRSGQRAYCTDTSKAAFVLVTWWPWGSGASISVRLKIMAPGMPEEEAAEIRKNFQEWFGVKA